MITDALPWTFAPLAILFCLALIVALDEHTHPR